MVKTPKEHIYFQQIRQHVTELHNFLNTHTPPIEDDSESWFEFIANIRMIQGNISNDQSFLATMLAKRYLMSRFDLIDFDAAEKAQGTPGLDIDIKTVNGDRIVGEIKTTIPYGENDLGSAQRTSFEKDFSKLNSADAPYKFFFVTNQRTFDIVQARYAHQISGVEIVFLLDH